MEKVKKSKLLLIIFSFLFLVLGMSPTEMKPAAKRRDPFKSPLDLEPKQTPQIATSAILKYALSELKLVGIIWGSLGRVAVVEAPDGKCYLIKKGEEIGKLRGKVKKINKENIVVQNLFADYAGRTKEQEITLKLYKEEKQKYQITK